MKAEGLMWLSDVRDEGGVTVRVQEEGGKKKPLLCDLLSNSLCREIDEFSL